MSGDALELHLSETIMARAKDFGVTLTRSDLTGKFTELVETLAKREKVVILVDEYDKPIIDNLGRPQAEDIRQIMEGFYSVIKATEPCQRFVLLTGVSKFAQVSVFSKLNNLYDLSMDARFATMLGYTQLELEANFADRIDEVVRNQEIDRPELLRRLRCWYNGYCFHPSAPTVYNPVSVAKFFESGGEFKNYWFATATPTFLLKLVKAQRFDFERDLAKPLDELAFAAYDIGHLEALPLLFQTGYLTIKGKAELFGQTQYRLGFPNQEVEAAFNAYLLEEYGGPRKERSGVEAAGIAKLLLDGEIDKAMENLKAFLAGVPYDLHVKVERYYQTIFYTVFRMLGIFVEVEVRTSDGRIDAVVKAGDNVYIFEFKLDGTASEALAQIRRKEYYAPYQAEGKRLILVGANFSTIGKGLVEWLHEVV